MSVQSEIDRIKGNVASAYNAVQEKGGTAPAGRTSANLAAAINSIQLGTDTSDATASAGDILSGKTAYAKGAKITGTIASKTASNLTASGSTVTVPAGYYASQATKSVATTTQATPTISVDSAGKITASATQTAGYVSAGTKSATQQLTAQAAATVTPGTAAKTAVAADRYTTGAVTVAGDANLVAENIRSGVSIFGVEGTFGPELYELTVVNEDVSVAVSFVHYMDDTGYHSVTVGKGSTVTLMVCPLVVIGGSTGPTRPGQTSKKISNATAIYLLGDTTYTLSSSS